MPDTFLAIEIGGTKLQLVAGLGDGTILDRRQLVVDRDRGAKGIRAQIVETLPALRKQWNPQAIGIGFGGPVDAQTGQVCESFQIPGWSRFELGAWMTEVSALPTFVENDANLAALGEARCGAGRGLRLVFYVTLGSGVGAGLVMDGRLFHASPPGEMEFGHTRLDRVGTTVEDRCSGWALDQRVTVAAAAQSHGMLATLLATESGPPARLLGRALEAGDAAAGVLFEKYTADLAFGLSPVVHLLHPDLIVLGGGVSLLGERLRDGVARHLSGFVMEAFQPGLAIGLAALREDAVPVGALLFAQQRLLAP